MSVIKDRAMYCKGLVSIIVPCYNGSRYISIFLESVLKQKYTKLQLIIINDGSLDDSDEKLLAYGEKLQEKNIEYYFVGKKNGGLGNAIHTGLQMMRGEYFIWFNIDDILTPDAILKMKEYLDAHNEYAIVRPDVYIVSEDKGEVLYRINDNNPDKAKPDLFENAITEKNFTFGCSMLKTTLFDRVNQERYIYESRQGQNWQLLLPMFYYYKSGYIDEPLYYVVEQKESTSRVSDPHKKIEQVIEYENIILKTLDSMTILDKEYWIEVTKERYAHRLIRCADRVDFRLMKECYDFLKHKGKLNKDDKCIWNSRFKKLEYWLELKHLII